jgi:hypothetical protein
MIYPQIIAIDVNGVTIKRLHLQFFNAVTGVTYPITAMPVGSYMDISFDGYLK